MKSVLKIRLDEQSGALGYLLANAPNDAYYQTGKLIFFNASPNFENLKSIRGIANTMIGISYYLKKPSIRRFNDGKIEESRQYINKNITRETKPLIGIGLNLYWLTIMAFYHWHCYILLKF